MALSPREQEILAGVESLLSDEDPRLAEQFSGTRPFWSWFPLTPLHTVLLVLTLLGLVGLGSIGPVMGDLGLGALTCASVTTWLVLAVRASARRG